MRANLDGRPPLHPAMKVRNRAVAAVLRAREEEAAQWDGDDGEHTSCSPAAEEALRASPPKPPMLRRFDAALHDVGAADVELTACSSQSLAMPGLVEVVWRRVAFFLGRKSPREIGRLLCTARVLAEPQSGLWRIYCVDRWPALRVYQPQSLDGHEGVGLRPDLFGAIARRRSHRPELLTPSDDFTNDAKLLIDVMETGVECRLDPRSRSVLSRVEPFKYRTFAGAVATFASPLPLCDITDSVRQLCFIQRQKIMKMGQGSTSTTSSTTTGDTALTSAAAAWPVATMDDEAWSAIYRGMIEGLEGRDFDEILDPSRLHLRCDVLKESDGTSACLVCAHGSTFVDGLLVGARPASDLGDGSGSVEADQEADNCLVTSPFGLRFLTPVTNGWKSFPVALVAEAVMIVRAKWSGAAAGTALLEALELRVSITAEGEDMPRFSMLNTLEHLLRWE